MIFAVTIFAIIYTISHKLLKPLHHDPKAVILLVREQCSITDVPETNTTWDIPEDRVPRYEIAANSTPDIVVPANNNTSEMTAPANMVYKFRYIQFMDMPELWPILRELKKIDWFGFSSVLYTVILLSKVWKSASCYDRFCRGCAEMTHILIFYYIGRSLNILFNDLVKKAVGEMRPCRYIINNPDDYNDMFLSFYSGTACREAYCAVYTFLFWTVYVRRGKPSVLRPVLTVVPVMSGMVVCLERLVHEEHWPIDVGAAVVVGSVMALAFFVPVLERKTTKNNNYQLGPAVSLEHINTAGKEFVALVGRQSEV